MYNNVLMPALPGYFVKQMLAFMDHLKKPDVSKRCRYLGRLRVVLEMMRCVSRMPVAQAMLLTPLAGHRFQNWALRARLIDGSPVPLPPIIRGIEGFAEVLDLLDAHAEEACRNVMKAEF